MDFFSSFAASCPQSHFTCTSGKCIPAHWRCDNHVDCDDGSDESAECCKFRFSLHYLCLNLLFKFVNIEYYLVGTLVYIFVKIVFVKHKNQDIA